MNFKKFNYYGFDKNSYMQCLDMIHSTNLKHIGILNIFFIIYTGLFSIFSIMGQFGVNRRNFNYYMVFFVAFTLFELFLVLGKKYTGRIAIVLTYIQLFLIVSFAIVGSLTWPYYIATTFLVMVVICSLSYIDNMLRMSIALILSSAVLLYIAALLLTSPQDKQI